ncbi:HpcH/HpaI aldolase/citrate lyase family protein [Pararhizobium sp. BT-229]|uniref:HpcH/HpaI aldolase/citrate lyase family protein n=1 Tax=Pararhizobium sp. BT-229 TaxID=2986923 RepID=UPI0021F78FAD|nr:HpcH/HpaI aldolase/citrate lyase family protein [Pararhizobium sp. BT-229]MCV9967345.1 HpcH/HpaI aldolase/citrate lyase family protein [Pararhizobium sp. BT-229]
MPAPKNTFKAAIRQDQFQLGLWVALASPYAAEVVSGSGYDWLLIDGEHGPNDIPLLSAQIAAVARSGSHPMVRLPIGETWMIKQVLDTGAQTLLIPMVESVEQAQALVRAVRYPPHGIRGVGAALGRASHFSRIGDYLETANDEICLIVQIESRAGLAALDDIAALDGVDGLFIGPSDLAADMGFLGQPGHPKVTAAIKDAFERIKKAGKARGIMTLSLDQARLYRDMGANFMAIGTDVTLLVNATTRLREDFLTGGGTEAKPVAGY